MSDLLEGIIVMLIRKRIKRVTMMPSVDAV
jgi:hypothetical protein